MPQEFEQPQNEQVASSLVRADSSSLTPDRADTAGDNTVLAGVDDRIANAKTAQEALDWSIVRASVVRQQEYVKHQANLRRVERRRLDLEVAKLRAKYVSGATSFAVGTCMVIVAAFHPALAVQALGGFLIGGGLWVTIPDYVKWWHSKQRDDNDDSI